MFISGYLTLFLSVHLVRLCGCGPLVCPSFRNRPTCWPACRSVGFLPLGRLVGIAVCVVLSVGPSPPCLSVSLPAGGLAVWSSVCQPVRLSVFLSVFLADLVWLPVGTSVGMFRGRLVGLSLCQSAGRSILWCYLSVGWPVYWIVRLTTCLFFGLSAGPSASRSVCMVVGFPLRMDVRRLV